MTSTTLPPEDEMMRLLMQQCGDERCRRHYYPLLVVHAGKTKTGYGLVQMLNDSLLSCAETLGLDLSDSIRAQYDKFVLLFAKDDAVLIAHAKRCIDQGCVPA